jgi:hypothetical protein
MAGSYRCNQNVLLNPASSHETTGLRTLGTIEGRHFYVYSVDLGAASPEAEEKKLVEAVKRLAGTKGSASRHVETPDIALSSA